MFTRIFTHSLISGECASLTSSPRTSSISLFSLSPGPMCRSVKSSCRGNILSICLEEMAEEVLRPLNAASADADGDGEQADAPRVRNLPWTFNAKRLLPVRCRHGALGFADLAKKSPQDLAQLCISAISLLGRIDKPETLSGALSSARSAVFPADPCWNLWLTPQKPEFIQPHRFTKSDQSNRSALRDVLRTPQ